VLQRCQHGLRMAWEWCEKCVGYHSCQAHVELLTLDHGNQLRFARDISRSSELIRLAQRLGVLRFRTLLSKAGEISISRKHKKRYRNTKMTPRLHRYDINECNTLSSAVGGAMPGGTSPSPLGPAPVRSTGGPPNECCYNVVELSSVDWCQYGAIIVL
jgi:hypothetical protein